MSMMNPSALTLECVARGALGQYTFRVMVPVVVALTGVVCYLVTQPFRRPMNLPRFRVKDFSIAWTFDKAINAMFTIFHIFFIMLAVTTALPLQCYSHPSGGSSMVFSNEVLCWSSDHTGFLVLGALLLFLFALPFYVLCLWVCYVAPGKCLQKPFMTRFHFILFKFRPDVWWWGPILVTRQICLAFASSVPADDPHGQSTYVIFILGVYMGALIRLFPWKTWFLNYAEGSLLLLLILVVKGCSSFIGKKPEFNTKNEAVMWTAISILLAEIVGWYLFIGFKYFILQSTGEPWTFHAKGAKQEKGELVEKWMSVSQASIDAGDDAMKT